jgi:hypothetical protein
MGIKFGFLLKGYKVILDCGVLRKMCQRGYLELIERKQQETGKKNKSNEEIQISYHLLNIITINKLRRIKLEGCVDHMREARNPLKILFLKYEEKIQLVRPPSRWV